MARQKPDENKKNLLEALYKTLGNVSEACKMLGLNRAVHYQYCSNDPDYKQAVKDVSEKAIDFVESKLFELINGVTTQTGHNERRVYKTKPDTTAIIFYLKTKAKHRGYVEKQQIEEVNKQPQEVELTQKQIDKLIDKL